VLSERSKRRPGIEPRSRRRREFEVAKAGGIKVRNRRGGQPWGDSVEEAELRERTRESSPRRVLKLEENYTIEEEGVSATRGSSMEKSRPFWNWRILVA